MIYSFKDVIKKEKTNDSNYNYLDRLFDLRGKINNNLVKNASIQVQDNTIISYVFPATYKSLQKSLYNKKISASKFRDCVNDLYYLLDPKLYCTETDFL